MYFHYFALILPWKDSGAHNLKMCQVWLKLAHCFWRRRKCEKFTTTTTTLTITTTDKLWSEKLTWTFRSAKNKQTTVLHCRFKMRIYMLSEILQICKMFIIIQNSFHSFHVIYNYVRIISKFAKLSNDRELILFCYGLFSNHFFNQPNIQKEALIGERKLD